MVIGTAEIKIHIPWSHSLKEKRMEIKSIMSKVQNKFNVSITETDEQDIHQIAVIGLACITNSIVQADSIIENILHYIESITEAEIINIDKEII